MIALVPLGKGHSLYSFIDRYCFSSINLSVHRLCSLMRKMGVECAIVEDIDSKFPEIEEECAAINVRHSGAVSDMKAFRITFVSEKLSDIGQIVNLDNKKFLSSLILINFQVGTSWTSYIFRAIVTIPKLNADISDDAILNNYIHLLKQFPCEINITNSTVHSFNIVGNYFAQQNNATSVCGHAALCMALNNMIDFTSAIAPEIINKSLGVDHKNRKFGADSGLRIEEIRDVLKNFNLKCNEAEFWNFNYFEYNEKIYRYIESGLPVLLIFSTKDSMHVIAVVGHTLNSDLWRPEAEVIYTKAPLPKDQIRYRPSSAWVDHFIIHDDNFGMYRCLPSESLKRITVPKYDPSFRAYHSLMIVPSDVETPAFEAELASVKVTKDILIAYKNSKAGVLNYWLDRLLCLDNAGMVSAVRTILVKKSDYANSLEEKDFEGNSFTNDNKTELLKDLPDRFWLSEITLPDLYTANKTKILDFFYPSDKPIFSNVADVTDRWIQIRFPEALLKKVGKGFSVHDLAISSHYPLFRLSSGKRTLEW